MEIKHHAYRNLKICTKDCLCLFVCPTGATDNETGQIDFDKCIGCGSCAMSCPSRAITMVPNKMPPQKKKDKAVIEELFKIADSKIEQIKMLRYNLNNSKDEDEKRFFKALIHSNKVMEEDIFREASYMLPQSKNANKFLKSLLNKDDKIDIIINNLLDKLQIND